MFTLTFRRRRRIQALILGLAVTAVAPLGVSVMGASAASALPAAAGGCACGCPCPAAAGGCTLRPRRYRSCRSSPKFVQSRPAPGLADVRTEPRHRPFAASPAIWWTRPVWSAGTTEPSVARTTGRPLLAGGLAIAVTGVVPARPTPSLPDQAVILGERGAAGCPRLALGPQRAGG